MSKDLPSTASADPTEPPPTTVVPSAVESTSLPVPPGAFHSDPTEIERPQPLVIRKKLPWLDSTRRQSDSAPVRDTQNIGAALTPDDSRETAIAGRMDPGHAEIRDDLAASSPTSRPAETLPSLRESSDSRLRRQEKAPASLAGLEPDQGTKRPFAINRRGTGPSTKTALPSSEYSAGRSTTETITPPRAAGTPVDDHGSSHISNRYQPLKAFSKYLLNELDLPLESDVSPSETPLKTQLKAKPSNGRLKTPKGANAEQSPELGAEIELQDMSKPKKAQPPNDDVAKTAPAWPVVKPVQLPQKTRTLHSLPTHLLSPSSTTSQDSPIVSIPRQSFSSRPPQGQSAAGLTQAVNGLENLMGEALSVARDAANAGRPDEVADLLNNASSVLKDAGSIHQHMRQPQPVVRVADRTSESSSSSYISSRTGFHQSAETLPTAFTQSTKSSAQPVNASRRPRHDHRHGHHSEISGQNSISYTPPRLYQPASVDSMVRDFAYSGPKGRKSHDRRASHEEHYGQAADYYGDQGQSVAAQPGVRRSFARPKRHRSRPQSSDGSSEWSTNQAAHRHHVHRGSGRRRRRNHAHTDPETRSSGQSEARHRTRGNQNRAPRDALRELAPRPTNAIPERATTFPTALPKTRRFCPLFGHSSHRSQRAEVVSDSRPDGVTSYEQGTGTNAGDKPASRYDDNAPGAHDVRRVSETERYSSMPPSLSAQNYSLRHPRRHHISLTEGQGFSLGRYHKRQPIAREWNQTRKRLTAMIACLNTIFIGLIAGIYAGEVPRIQYQLADQSHWVITGNVLLFAGLGLSTLIFWPLPLLHGRKPYTLLSFACMLPLQFPQAITVSAYRSPDMSHRVGLLLPRFFTGFALGFVNINTLPTLFDLFGASLMSNRPHQEVVTTDDVRRQGGGLGVWLGIWTFCFSSSLSIGFCMGAGIIHGLNPGWGFYLVVILLAFFLLVNVIAPETRRAPYRRSIAHFFDDDEPDKLKRRVARGEIKLHISNDGPKWWFEEVWAGLVLMKRMALQPGFFILMWYLAWVQAELNLIILFLGALLSREYEWQSGYVGLAVLAVPLGALLAMPLTKASWFSRSRSVASRTDSMTFQPRITWTSHLLRRTIFTILLPFAALGYCLSARGPPLTWVPAVVFAGFLGFLTDLGIAECVGLIMETFDTCDLQPGVNTKHRLQSMSSVAKRRRTNYSSFPRVCAAFFAAQSLGFFLSAAATGVSGVVTRTYGSQTAIAVVAAIVLAVTLLLLTIIWRWRQVQVIPNYTSDAAPGERAFEPQPNDPEWKAVVIGNPSGKMRRMNVLEMGKWTRWTEVRKLNKLVPE